jgi:hypothetical protein
MWFYIWFDIRSPSPDRANHYRRKQPMHAHGREAASGLAYARHRPEATLLYRLVEQHYPAFVAHQLAAVAQHLREAHAAHRGQAAGEQAVEQGLFARPADFVAATNLILVIAGALGTRCANQRMAKAHEARFKCGIYECNCPDHAPPAFPHCLRGKSIYGLSAASRSRMTSNPV